MWKLIIASVVLLLASAVLQDLHPEMKTTIQACVMLGACGGVIGILGKVAGS